MRTARKPAAWITVFIVLLLMMLPGTFRVHAYADWTANLAVTSAGVANWKAYDGAEWYLVSVKNKDNGASISEKTSGLSLNVKTLMDTKKVPSGNYTISVYGGRGASEQLTNEASISYNNFVSQWKKTTLSNLRWGVRNQTPYRGARELSCVSGGEVSEYIFRILRSRQPNDSADMSVEVGRTSSYSNTWILQDELLKDFSWSLEMRNGKEYYYQFEVIAIGDASKKYLNSDPCRSEIVYGKWLADGYYTGCRLEDRSIRLVTEDGKAAGIGSDLKLTDAYGDFKGLQYVTIEWQSSPDGVNWQKTDPGNSVPYQLYVADNYKNMYIRGHLYTDTASSVYYFGETYTNVLHITKKVVNATPAAPTLTLTSAHEVKLSGLSSSLEYYVTTVSVAGGPPEALWESASAYSPSNGASYTYSKPMRLRPTSNNSSVTLKGTALYNKTVYVYTRYKETDQNLTGTVVVSRSVYNKVSVNASALEIKASLKSGNAGCVGAIYEMTFSCLPSDATDYAVTKAFWNVQEGSCEFYQTYSNGTLSGQFRISQSGLTFSKIYVKLSETCENLVIEATGHEQSLTGTISMEVLRSDGKRALRTVTLPPASALKVPAGSVSGFSYSVPANTYTGNMTASPSLGDRDPSWFPEVIFSQDGTFTVDASRTVPGTYTFDLVDVNGDELLDVTQTGKRYPEYQNTFDVVVTQALVKPEKVVISPAETNRIKNSSVSFSASSVPAGGEIYWYTDDAYLGSGPQITYTVEDSTGSDVTVYAVSQGVSAEAVIHVVSADQLQGWQKISGKWYYYDTAGNAVTGWKKFSGKWYYFDNAGIMQTGWTQISGKWYYFASGGVMQTGWQKISEKWYYFESSGAMVTGWQKISGKWYYFASGGVMQTGWQKISDKWYYFESGGAMVTGWKQLAGKWYYFESSGAMVTGWKTLGGTTYYFKASGAMAAKEWCSGWWLNADGSWTYKYKASWTKNAKGWWFGDTSGWYAKSVTLTIDDKKYTFDANGYWVK